MIYNRKDKSFWILPFWNQFKACCVVLMFVFFLFLFFPQILQNILFLIVKINRKNLCIMSWFNLSTLLIPEKYKITIQIKCNQQAIYVNKINQFSNIQNTNANKTSSCFYLFFSPLFSRENRIAKQIFFFVVIYKLHAFNTMLLGLLRHP